MPDTNEAIGAKLTLNFSGSTFICNWNMVSEGLSIDLSNTLHFAVPKNKIPVSLIIKR